MLQMKKYLIFLLLFCFSNITKSQILISLLLGDKLNSPKLEFGLAGGVNMATIDGIDGVGYQPLFNLGFYFDFKLKNPHWLINTGVMVKSTLGANNIPVYSLNNQNLDTVLANGSVVRKLQYFNVPVMLRYKFKSNFYINAGVLLGLMHGAYDDFTNSVQETDDLSYRSEVKSSYKALDAGPVLGIGYRLLSGKGMNIGVYGYAGLVNIQKNNLLPEQYNRSVYFLVGIPIGAGKNSLEISTP